MAKKRNEDLYLVEQRRHLESYYRERLTNMALAQFEWTGLPDTVDRWYMEKTLFYNGRAAFYIPEGLDFWMCTGWQHSGGQFNSYGYPTDIKGIDFNALNIPVSDFELIYDNMSRGNTMSRMVEIHTASLVETHQTFRTNLMHQNTPYLVSTSKQQLLSVKNVFKRMFYFDPVIEVDESFDRETISTVNTDVKYIGNELLNTRRDLWDDALSMLGISTGDTKRERLISDEVDANLQEGIISLNARLMNRVNLCNTLNEKHGLNISVRLSDEVACPEISQEIEIPNTPENKEQ